MADLERLREGGGGRGVGASLEEAFEVGKYGGVAGLEGEDQVRAAPMEVVWEGAFGLSHSCGEVQRRT